MNGKGKKKIKKGNTSLGRKGKKKKTTNQNL